MKMFVLRPKPSQINLDFANLDTAWLWRFDWTLDQVANFDARTRAFPSGNMATAMALTIGLCLIAPRGRWLYAMLCSLTVLQRLHSESHFLSDVVGGAAAGLLWSYVCLSPKLIGSLFDKMEPQTCRPGNLRYSRWTKAIPSCNPLRSRSSHHDVSQLTSRTRHRDALHHRSQFVVNLAAFYFSFCRQLHTVS